MVRAVVSRPAGRAVSTERRAAGARDNLSAAPATWLSILGLLRAPPAPLQLPRHPRVGLEALEQPLQVQALRSASLPQQTQAVQAFSVAPRTKVLASGLVLAQRRELVLV